MTQILKKAKNVENAGAKNYSSKNPRAQNPQKFLELKILKKS